MEQIFVKIDEENYNKLRNMKGFLEKKHYPPFHDKDSKDKELGSFMFFRVLTDV